jgi:threonylcarbamoyladenosine tRNA methylthiotransferase MtaB
MENAAETGSSGRKAPRVAFHTLGCKLNFSETSALRRLVAEAGFGLAEWPKEADTADAFVINTCSVTENADKKCRAVVRQALRRSPGAYVVVVGCYAQLKPQEIAEIPGVDLVLGAAEKFRLAEFLRDVDLHTQREQDGRAADPASANAPGQVHCNAIAEHIDFHSSWSHGDRTRSFLKVQDGCDYDCSFCTIPRARGRSRSDSIAGVLEKARALSANGTREIVLTGINLGDFGLRPSEQPPTLPIPEHLKAGSSPEAPVLSWAASAKAMDAASSAAPLPRPTDQRLRREHNFFDLVRALDVPAGNTDALPAELRLRISSIEPNLLDPELIDWVAASGRFMPHFHIPLQSGSDRILGLMRRRYRSALYADRVTRIRERMPHAAIGVDVIVGFPGEGEAEFLETADFLRELAVDYLHVFPYSEREHTAAVDLPGRVDPGERLRRSRILRGLSTKKRRALHERHSGEWRPVLFEAAEIPAPEGRESDGPYLQGFTDNYIKVRAPKSAIAAALHGVVQDAGEATETASFGALCRVRLGQPDADGFSPAMDFGHR